MKPIPSPEAAALNHLRNCAAYKHPARITEYRVLWRELWNVFRAKLGVSFRDMEQVRAVMIGFLVEDVPVETARMISIEFMKGLAK